MRIALLGSAPSSLPHAPFKNSQYLEWLQGKQQEIARCHGEIGGDFDIWGCSPSCWAQSPRATRWFEVHRWEPGKEWFSPEYVRFLEEFEGIVYTGANVPGIKGQRVYPIDRMEEKFSSYFMTSSVALMLALAIDTIEEIRACRNAHLLAKAKAPHTPHALPEGIKLEELEKDGKDDIIGLWGVDMGATEEYGFQRPGCQFFILEALRRGIGVFIPPESDLMRPMPVYGVSEWDHNYIKLTSRAREISGKAQRAQSAAEESKHDVLVSQGEMAALNTFVNTWTSPYGMLPGMVIRQEPGTGLGSGITHFDGRPVSRMHVAMPPQPVLAAMMEDPDTQLGRALKVRLSHYREQTGLTATPDPDLLGLVLAEAELARAHSAILQPYMRAGESTRDAIVRLAMPKGAKKAKRR